VERVGMRAGTRRLLLLLQVDRWSFVPRFEILLAMQGVRLSESGSL
jgi:hypothetical protein